MQMRILIYFLACQGSVVQGVQKLFVCYVLILDDSTFFLAVFLAITTTEIFEAFLSFAQSLLKLMRNLSLFFLGQF